MSGIKQVHMKPCTNCVAGKQNRISFKSSPPSRADKILDLVHSDLCGPMPLSLRGERYWVTIDDHSRKIWVCTLKTKDQVAETFKNFLNLVERQQTLNSNVFEQIMVENTLDPLMRYAKRRESDIK